MGSSTELGSVFTCIGINKHKNINDNAIIAHTNHGTFLPRPSYMKPNITGPTALPLAENATAIPLIVPPWPGGTIVAPIGIKVTWIIASPMAVNRFATEKEYNLFGG